MQEYWRKLYVGMTRAEDELYVTGVLTPGRDAGKQQAGTWYEAIEQALRPHSDAHRWPGEPAYVYPLERPAPKPVAALARAAAAAAGRPELPPLPPRRHLEVVRPSSAFVPGRRGARVRNGRRGRSSMPRRRAGRASRCMRCCSIWRGWRAAERDGWPASALRVLLPGRIRPSTRRWRSKALSILGPPRTRPPVRRRTAGPRCRSSPTPAATARRSRHRRPHRPAGGEPRPGAAGRLQVRRQSGHAGTRVPSRRPIVRQLAALCARCRPAFPRSDGRRRDPLD